MSDKPEILAYFEHVVDEWPGVLPMLVVWFPPDPADPDDDEGHYDVQRSDLPYVWRRDAVDKAVS